MMKRASLRILMCIVVLCTLASSVSAEFIRDGIEIEFVAIGNAGNAGDKRTAYPDSAEPYGAGAVAYNFSIGKYEITNGQWDAFVSAAGAPTGNDGFYSLGDAYGKNAYWTGDKIPTNRVSWYEAAQFCNYLTSGDKSLGAYQFSNGYFTGIDRDSAISTYGIAYVLPTEDEWYKAAYFKPDGSGYSTYANGTDTLPIKGVDSHYSGSRDSSPWEVGSGTEEQNGTFDMMGNVWECIETSFIRYDRIKHVRRGGSFIHSAWYLQSSIKRSTDLAGWDDSRGFRVAVVPEPCSLVLLGLGGLMFRCRKA